MSSIMSSLLSSILSTDKPDDGPRSENWMGNDTLRIPMELYVENRRRLAEAMAKKINKGTEAHAVVVLQGGDKVMRYNTDVVYAPFRQESFFLWATGVTEPGCYLALDVASARSVLFVPQYAESHYIYVAKEQPNEYYKKKYQVDEVEYVANIIPVLQKLDAKTLFTLAGNDMSSSPTGIAASFPGMRHHGFNIDKQQLTPTISELRVFKTKYELDVLRYACRISSEAHKAVMKAVRAGLYEYQMESTFLNYCYFNGGCRYVGYTCICGSGINGALLHYGSSEAPNNRKMLSGDMCLFDMGAEYFGYTADITCSFPVNGKFTQRQRGIYEAVLSANRAVHKAAKPSVPWYRMGYVAVRSLLSSLLELGLVQGSVDEMMTNGIGWLFMPHGLGHLIGLDVHDVNGSYNPDTDTYAERSEEDDLMIVLMIRGLQPGMVFTIEPGCYFFEKKLREAFNDKTKSQYLVQEVIESYLNENFGGVRIEDVVVVTETGIEDITDVPRTVAEIEACMASA